MLHGRGALDAVGHRVGHGGTRFTGTVRPDLVLWLEERERLAPHEVATALERRSGAADADRER
ncbi:hypothetical protein [Actinosynnema sp. NPDC023587]|uniref:hypothetical protein n=1 Tax=Actinosynnema sp. NPDC023587 TaxID=3154695 RepID=UPI0033DFDD10